VTFIALTLATQRKSNVIPKTTSNWT